MVRVHTQRAVSRGPVASRHRAADRKKPSYKVVFEEMSEKKRLKTFLSFNPEAPPGFTFIPAGDPQLTNRCKKIARELDSTVHIVSMSNPHNPGLSQEVHRVGYHFSSTVVENACQSLGVTLTESGRVAQSSLASLDEDLPDRRPKKKPRRSGRASPKFDLSMPQETIDNHAREAIRDLFPKIPIEDLHQIVARSFQKGSHLVGTSSDLSLVRRAHLAVAAHIRHTHTDYDQLLRLVPWGEARRRVESHTLDKIIAWRGDDDADSDVMHDVLREVIVISDDEDDDNVAEDYPQSAPCLSENPKPPDNAELQFLSANNLHTQSVKFSKDDPPDMDKDEPIQFIHSHRNPFISRDRLREDRFGARRLQRWEDAVHRQRNPPQPLPSHRTSGDFSIVVRGVREGEKQNQHNQSSVMQHPLRGSYATDSRGHRVHEASQPQIPHHTSVKRSSDLHVAVSGAAGQRNGLVNENNPPYSGRNPFQKWVELPSSIPRRQADHLRHANFSVPVEILQPADESVPQTLRSERVLPSVETDAHDLGFLARNQFPVQKHDPTKGRPFDALRSAHTGFDIPEHFAESPKPRKRHFLDQGNSADYESLPKSSRESNRHIDRIVRLDPHDSHGLIVRDPDPQHEAGSPRIIQLPAKDAPRRPHLVHGDAKPSSDSHLRLTENVCLTQTTSPTSKVLPSYPVFEKTRSGFVRAQPAVPEKSNYRNVSSEKRLPPAETIYDGVQGNVRPYDESLTGHVRQLHLDNSQRSIVKILDPVAHDGNTQRNHLPRTDQYREHRGSYFVADPQGQVSHETSGWAAAQRPHDMRLRRESDNSQSDGPVRIVWLKKADDREPPPAPTRQDYVKDYNEGISNHHAPATKRELFRQHGAAGEVIILD